MKLEEKALERAAPAALGEAVGAEAFETRPGLRRRQTAYFFFSASRNGVIRSMGSGNTMVLLFSPAMLTSVCI